MGKTIRKTAGSRLTCWDRITNSRYSTKKQDKENNISHYSTIDEVPTETNKFKRNPRIELRNHRK